MADEVSVWRQLTGGEDTAPYTVDAADWLARPLPMPDPLVEGLVMPEEFVAVVGSSKAGKSFLALQLGLCIAAGIPFLGRATAQTPVMIANLEIAEWQYQTRLLRMVEAFDIAPEALRGKLIVQNLKKVRPNWERLNADADYYGARVVVVDPFYRIFEGEEVDEVAVQDAINAMSEILNSGKTLIVVFHAPKGFNGERNLIDLISGSSRLSRAPEAIIGILNHAEGADYRVLSTDLRNFRKIDDFTLRVDGGITEPDPAIVPAVETQASRLRRLKQLADEAAGIGGGGFTHGGGNAPQGGGSLEDAARRIVEANGGALFGVAELIERLHRETGRGQVAIKQFVRARVECGDWDKTPEMVIREDGKAVRKTGGKIFISTAQMIEAYKASFERQP